MVNITCPAPDLHIKLFEGEVEPGDEVGVPT